MELTGYKAFSLPELLKGIKEVDGSVIFNHTHHFVLRHQYWVGQVSNDFAHWVGEVLLESELAEKLDAIEMTTCSSVRQIREQLIEIIDTHIKIAKRQPVAPDGMEFQFVRANSIVFPTRHRVKDLLQFYETIRKVSINSIYFHIFEAKLRLEKGVNDFSLWFTEIGEEELARQVEQLDPYSNTLYYVRDQIAELIKKRL
jgi:hypothetical protein